MPEKAENNWKRGLGWPFFKTEKNRLTIKDRKRSK